MRRQNVAFVVLIVSLLIFIFFILPAINLNQFLESLKNVNLLLYFFALVVVFLGNVIFSLRWSLLMKEVNAPKAQEFFNAFGILSLGQATGLIVPSRVGSYAKVPFIMKSDNLSYETGLAAVNAETILDLAYICGAGIVSLLIMSTYFSKYPILSAGLIVLTIIFLAGVFVLLFLFRLLQSLGIRLAAISRDPGQTGFIRTPARYIGKLAELVISTRELFRKKRLLIELGSTTLMAQFFGVVGFFLVIMSTRGMLPFPEVFAVLTISYIIGIVSLIPGGLGASDISLIVLLASEGIPTAVAANIAILWRIVMYLPIFLVIGVYFIQQKLSKGKLPNDTS